MHRVPAHRLLPAVRPAGTSTWPGRRRCSARQPVSSAPRGARPPCRPRRPPACPWAASSRAGAGDARRPPARRGGRTPPAARTSPPPSGAAPASHAGRPEGEPDAAHQHQHQAGEDPQDARGRRRDGADHDHRHAEHAQPLGDHERPGQPGRRDRGRSVSTGREGSARPCGGCARRPPRSRRTPPGSRRPATRTPPPRRPGK